MRANLDSTGGLFFSQRVLSTLVERGMDRNDAYRAVQRAATETWERGLHFRERMWEEIESLGVVPREEFWGLFVLRPFVEHLGRVFDRLEKLEVAGASPLERRQPPWVSDQPATSAGAVTHRGRDG
jgi:adenylosuccinate lyase